MLVPVSEVVLQLVALVLQRVKGLVLDLPATACTGVRLGRGGSGQRQVRDPCPCPRPPRGATPWAASPALAKPSRVPCVPVGVVERHVRY